MPSPILARADALMHRQRQNDGAPDEIPVLTDALDDDIPLLLDIDEALLAAGDLPPAEESPPDGAEPSAEAIAAEPAAPPAPEAPPPQAVVATAADESEALLRDLSERLQQRLAAELPRLIEATLRDYLAERATLGNLPPAQQE